MNNHSRDSEQDRDTVDRRLRGRITKTTDAFEARFERIRHLPQAEDPAVARESAWSLLRFPGFVPAAAAAATGMIVGGLWLFQMSDTDQRSLADWMGTEVYLEDPFYWDQALESARVVLDEETLDAILYFAYEDKSS